MPCLYLLRRVDISRSYVLLIGAVDFVLLLGGRALSYWGVSFMRDRLGRYHYLLLVGCGPRAREMATLIEESRGMGLRLVGFVDPEVDGASAAKLGGYDVFPLTSVGSDSARAMSSTRWSSPSTCRNWRGWSR